MTNETKLRHLAIIMDGNGRWAELRRHDRTYGHLKGARVAKSIIEACAEQGLEQLTLYAFSTENWLRPKAEVSFLMRLLCRHLRKERTALVNNNIRFSVIGDAARLPEPVLQEIDETIRATAHCSGMSLTFALSYGGRQEITEAVRKIAVNVAEGRLLPEDITADTIAQNLQSSFMPEPDLIIRTSGECRLSNFMLWQAAYSELYVTPTLWPDFSKLELEQAVAHFATRERRYGRTGTQVRQVSLMDLMRLTTFSARRAPG